MGKVLIFGHQNPDTDAIGAAIAYANLQKELGIDAEAVALGTPNEETQFALEHFGLTAPRVVEKIAAETNEVMLVDQFVLLQESRVRMKQALSKVKGK